jgi:NAD(P)-dependent dehydrogenase (short-subunit alcohol dehydrogenase family)
MSDRAALVTGASRGIGLAIARVLAEEGYALTISGRDERRLSDVADSLASEGYDVQPIAADVARETDLTTLAASHLDRYGRIDVLVNNAGVGLYGSIETLDTARLDKVLAINVRSAVLLTRECASALKQAGAEHGQALLVNTASISGKSAQPYLSVYGATKYGLVGFTEAMNRELGPHGVKACALCPSYVDTDLTEPFRETISPETMIQPSDIAEAVRYLTRTSPACVVPEMQFLRPGGVL